MSLLQLHTLKIVVTLLQPKNCHIIIRKELTKVVYKLAIMLLYELDENSICDGCLLWNI